MTITYYESPFHVTHSDELANKIKTETDEKIISDSRGCCIVRRAELGGDAGIREVLKALKMAGAPIKYADGALMPSIDYEWFSDYNFLEEGTVVTWRLKSF